jgi:hypothetical protein
MGFFDLILKAGRRKPTDDDRAYNAASIRIGEEYASQPATAINQVDFNRVGRSVAGSVWNAASIIASECASHQLRLYRKAGAGESVRKARAIDPKTKAFLRGKSLGLKVTAKQAAMADSAEDIEEVTDHPVLDLLADPDPMTTASDFLTMLFWYRETAGKAYVWTGDKAEDEAPTGLYLLHPQFTQPIVNQEQLIAGYRYGREVTGILEVPASQVIFSPWQRDPFRPWDGMSWLTSIEQYADAENAALVAEVQRWKNHGQVGFILKVPMSYTDQQMKQVEAALKSKAGPFAAGRALILRDIELVQSSARPHEMGYQQGLEQSEKAIYRAAGVPESIWKLNEANLASAEVGERMLLRSCYKRMRRVAEDFTSYLLPMFGEEIGNMWFGYENPDLDDQVAEASMMSQAFSAGVIDEAEYRKVLFLPPREQPQEQEGQAAQQPLEPQQISTLTGLAQSVAKGELPQQNAMAIASAAFPTIATEVLQSVFGNLEGHSKPQQEPPETQQDSEAPVEKPVADEAQVQKSVAAELDLTPPKGAQNAAKRALEWRKEHNRGMTAVGVARARDLSNGKQLSEDTVMRMVSFFARHEVDKQAEGFEEGENGFPSAGRIAWDGWGGDAGASWAKRMAERIEARRAKKSLRNKNCGTGAGGFQSGNNCAGGGGGGEGNESMPNASDLQVTKNLGGSTGAKLGEDAEGNKYVIKGGKSAEHIRSEFAANQMYSAAGVVVPEHKLDTTDPNNPKQITRFIKATPFGNLSGVQQENAAREIRKGFAMDALVANWDVIGLSGDNILVDSKGVPVRVDNGGSLEYRAQGKQKAFSNVVGELNSMRTSEQGAPVFGSLSDKDVAEQIDGIVSKREKILKATPENLRSVVSKRIDYMRDWAKSVR